MRLTRRRLAASGLALLGATAVAGVASADSTLVVADDEGDRLLEVPVEQGAEITISYTHSAQKTPVEDVYVVDGSQLRADRSVFHSFGAGLPTDVERTDEGYLVEGTGSYDELHLAPGEVAGHELVVGEDRYDLVELADGQAVLFVTDRTVVDALASSASSLGSSEPTASAGSNEPGARTDSPD